jgi:hypothetical protein
MQLRTIDETALHYRVSVSLLRKHVDIGTLPVIRIGRRVLVDWEAFDHLLSDQGGLDPLPVARAKSIDNLKSLVEKVDSEDVR